MLSNPIVRGLGTILLLASAATFAGTVERRQVAGDAQWVIHLDVQRLHASQLGAELLKVISRNASGAGAMNDALNKMRTQLGLDPAKDLDSLTAYGKAVPGAPDAAAQQEAVILAVFGATSDAAKFYAKLSQQEGSEATKYGKYQLVKIAPADQGGAAKREAPATTDPAPPPTQPAGPVEALKAWVCLVKPTMILFGESQTELQHALDVLDGKRDSLAGSKAFPHLTQPGLTPLVVATANLGETALFRQGQDAFPMFSQLAGGCSLAVSEVQPTGATDPAAARLDVVAIMDAKTEETALQTKQAVDGIVAMVKAKLMDPPPPAQVIELVDKLKCTAQGREVKLTFAYPVKELFVKVAELQQAFGPSPKGAGAAVAPGAAQPAPGAVPPAPATTVRH